MNDLKLRKEKEARKLTLSGIVQGVGFRPFVFRLANSLDLKGRVINTGEEVEILLEGPQQKIKEFIRRLKNQKPRAAEIYSLSSKKIESEDFDSFKIARSKEKVSSLSMIPPDFGVCEECLKEIEDPSLRRYQYPFNSCAHCGPRFSAIKKVPYDRENTSMVEFPLCEECRDEYTNRTNIRRGHIQGISCPECGPNLWLTDRKGNVIEGDPILKATNLINQGKILGIKGIGGFHIASLATNDEVVQRLRDKKRRPQKPFALMALNLETARRIVKIRPEDAQILTSSRRPILLLPEKTGSSVSKYVAPGLRTLGVMLAYTGTHHLLLKSVKDHFLIMTSGNPRGEPICKGNSCAISKLSKKVDYFLLHNREIFNRTDDSVLRVTYDDVTMLRRSRGFAPTWFNLPMTLKHPQIAFGADLKNTGSVGVKDKAIPTQYIGDLYNISTLRFFEEAIKFLIETYEISPSNAALVADLHPQYQSRHLAEKWKEKFNAELKLVQHHYAHIVSAMIDRNVPLGEKVVGIAIDGVGYGKDGNIWGGEILLSDYKGWKRVGHLQYQPMPGGDRATKYPVRMLVGILSRIMDRNEIRELIRERKLTKGLKYGEQELHVVLEQSKSPNILTSSLGRTLDAISALLGICFSRNYEGEAAMKLESAGYTGKRLEGIDIPITRSNGKFIIETSPLFRSLLENLGKKRRSLAFTAQIEIGRALGKIAKQVAESYGSNRIVASGGSAVNTLLIRGIKRAIRSSDLELLLPRRIPAGDGGISLGQIGATIQ
ncbi:MAG: carbamoyltransferase HypF [Candidatus Korarchaeota archaeon]|nr:carbamoyltransferase HypF [Candidatus Korarchaeota archaeon]NIU85409.1 carbamoyltransferase HypF [Candidatus Thorarchaeota archaeon]NIW15506.1 carbamoyltransferase HypF [Candidatus Thorarchaeota archaeon]NIW53451.1 carbamoyltransferase HypF [Candidatus Korarchaeota archaeon]